MTTTTAADPATAIDLHDEQARMVAEMLVGMADDDAQVSVPLSRLASATTMASRTLQRVLERLEAAGWVSICRGDNNRPSTYDVSAMVEAGVIGRRLDSAAQRSSGSRVLSEPEARSPLGEVVPGERVLVDPALLDSGSNIRRNLKLSEAFVETLRAQGVLRDLHVYPTLTGLVVHDGHRRLAGALKAGLETVPCLVVSIDDEQARIERQLVMNDEAEHVTSVERAEAIEQLVLMGVPRQDIHRRTGAHLGEIRAARKIAKAPETVRDLGRRTPSLDLIALSKVAALADETSDEESLARVVEEIEADPAQIDHIVEMHSCALRHDRLISEAIHEYEAKGVRAVDLHDLLASDGPRRWKLLTDLEDEHGNRLDEVEHASCPGHAMAVTTTWSIEDEERAASYVVCLEWAANGHRNRYATPASGATSGPQPAEVAAARALVRKHNDAWDAACAVRRTWIRDTLLKQRRVPNDAASYELRVARWALANVSSSARSKGMERVGVDPDALVAPASTVAAERGLLGLHLACVEGVIERDSWRDKPYGPRLRSMIKHHLRYLISWGYVPSDIEREVIADADPQGGEGDE
ncbi:MAG: ParB N-terminal domain-containing protein [Actinomyces urogenitalis]|uniref:ParB/RepB/Spo0J family partition protein n=1 Tax=Actinomyces urogenitalis TaxID=103621 RepID=UPI00065FAB5E|nr:ParB N-terminal domain-containing protein [Actinomyces urogenitalis]MBS6071737.1 ParB N-terminal domain-containing protein [Actinomyces urogenitalis]MDU0864594.1 ParB N-terminal domain-containing protein [Actinomyces urogenitalis]MDU0875140.1 ParB N-terminal domain-containing protein [Actinomyces urogenitalis]MDU1564613.1 ParB N-terminal domain-containing protein [Actinomyces urogenitalis]MDU1640178.1 ParB N-terminal domain-containing protein [Actinomyces urogenitalis]